MDVSKLGHNFFLEYTFICNWLRRGRRWENKTVDNERKMNFQKKSNLFMYRIIQMMARFPFTFDGSASLSNKSSWISTISSHMAAFSSSRILEFKNNFKESKGEKIQSLLENTNWLNKIGFLNIYQHVTKMILAFDEEAENSTRKT